MFYYLLAPLRDAFTGFNLFVYPTFRAALAAISAFAICVYLGPPVIRLLRRVGAGEVVATGSETLDERYQEKNGVPSMGGVLILLALVGSTLLFGRLDNLYTVLALWTVVALGLVGAWDDWAKLSGRKRRGMSTKGKLVAQLLVTLTVVSVLYANVRDQHELVGLQFPFFKDWVWDLGIFYLVTSTIVVIGSSNAVNLTDGVDGLAIGCTVMVGLTFCVICYVVGERELSTFLRVTHVAGASELLVFCGALVGAGLGFLWFNCYPATVIMGDTGSLPLGGALGLVAVMARAEFQLLVAGGIFVIEALSVMIQVFVYRRTRVRVFLCAPLHHHFQMRGWHDMKVVVRFWILMAIFGMASLAMFKVR